jgi:hypothetical protein
MGQKDVLMHVYGSYPTKQDMELTNKDIGEDASHARTPHTPPHNDV